MVVDDDPVMLKACQMLFDQNDMEVVLASSPAEARSMLALQLADVILVDLNYTPGVFDGHEGLAFVSELRRLHPRIGIIVFSGYSGVALAVRAIREGADDFVVKPWRNDKLIAVITDVLKRARSTESGARQIGTAPSLSPIVGTSAASESIRSAIDMAAANDAAVFISGGAGMGKSLIAAHIHARSDRAHRAMVKLDAGALDPARESAAEVALADDPTDATVLLRSVEQLDPRCVARVGHWLDAGVRILSNATAPSLSLLHGTLGRDGLIYRLATIELNVPALERREEDIIPLADHYLRLFAHRHGLTAQPVSPRLTALWRSAEWSGGIHQLVQLAERSILLRQPLDLLVEHYAAARAGPTSIGRIEDNLSNFERKLVNDAVQRHDGNISLAARDLGLSRASLYRRLKKYDG